MRLLAILILTVAIIFGIIYYYQNFFTKKDIVVSNIYRFIPTDATIIIESKNISKLKQRLKNNCKPWLLLSNIENLKVFEKRISFIDSIYQNHPLFKFNSEKGPVLISFHPCGKNDLNELYIAFTGSNTKISAIKALIKDIYKQNVEFQERLYNEQTIFSIKTNDTNFYSQYFAFFIDGWLFISPHSLLIESVVRQSKSYYSLFDNPSFEKIIKTSGQNVEINIFINHNSFPFIWTNWLTTDVKKSISKKYSLADWSAIDLHISPNMFLLNGFTDTGDSLTNFFKIITSQDPINISVTEILPKETYFFLFYSISNFSIWYNNYEKHLESYGLLKKQQTELESITKKTGINYKKLFAELIYKENAFVISQNQEVNTPNSSDDYFWIIRTANKSSAKELLDSSLLKYAKISGNKKEDLQISIKIDADYSTEAYVFPFPNVPQYLFGKAFSIFQAKFYSIIDNYIVFASSKDALRRFHYAYILKKTLQNDKLYKTYTDMIDPQANLLLYFDISRSNNYLKNILNDKLYSFINNNFDIFRQLDAITLQLTNSNNMLYTSLFVRYTPEIKETTHTVWESKLDTTISMKPVFVINHNTQEKEIFVQDNFNNIYLINTSGRILWKNHIPEKIKSDIFQIDIFNNKKLQYLFNTKNYIYVIDRNGDIVHPFPIKLKAPATNGINVADLNGKNDIRLMIACNDKNVYCYTLQGKIDKIWKFNKTNHLVYQPIQYVKYDQKEYFYFADTLNIYIVNRQGKEVISIKENIPINRKALLYFEHKNKETDARFLINDIYGNINFIDLKGQVTKLKLDKKSAEHYFLYNDMDGDGLSEFIFIDINKLTIYKRNKKLMLNFKIPCLPKYKPVYYEFPMAKHKIGLVCENKLYLIDREGNMPSGFPLNGISPFSITHLSKPIKTYFLITVNDNGYLINYEVFR